ncbi:hypothetical protein GCM10022224_056550 [Nonomuraea antimicrobica]|uniref:Uncharacterized protein n=1 Tax=Nonomuraea antimicrobica TaxID=561173 RepID=A0ABP7C9W9_9ACTN
MSAMPGTAPYAQALAHARQSLGDDFERLDAHQRERLIASGEAFFGADLPGVTASPPARVGAGGRGRAPVRAGHAPAIRSRRCAAPPAGSPIRPERP